jgi:hypothetical protein
MKFDKESSLAEEICDTKMFSRDLDCGLSQQKEMYPSLLFEADLFKRHNNLTFEESSSIYRMVSEDEQDDFCIPPKVSYETNVSDFVFFTDRGDTLNAEFLNDDKKDLNQQLFADNRVQLNQNSDEVNVHHPTQHGEHINVRKKLTKLPSSRIGSRCRKSKCMRLHCRCFKDLEYCAKFCKCLDCLNTISHQSARDFVIKKTAEINSNAFINKFSVIPSNNKKSVYIEGCLCKTGCNRNYCECFKNGAGCSLICKCANCQNAFLALPREELRSLAKPAIRKKNRIEIRNSGVRKTERHSRSNKIGGQQMANIIIEESDVTINLPGELPRTLLESRDEKGFVQYVNYKKEKLESKHL